MKRIHKETGSSAGSRVIMMSGVRFVADVPAGVPYSSPEFAGWEARIDAAADLIVEAVRYNVEPGPGSHA